MFPTASQSKLNLEDYSSSIYSASPSSFTDSADSKLCGSRTLDIPVAEGKLSAMRLQLTLAETISESLWSSRLAVVADFSFTSQLVLHASILLLISWNLGFGWHCRVPSAGGFWRSRHRFSMSFLHVGCSR
jgi:hypothetical protein